MNDSKKEIAQSIAVAINDLEIKIETAKQLGLTVEIERFTTGDNRLKNPHPDVNSLKCTVYEHVIY